MLENNSKTFTFTYEGKTYTIPSIKSMPNGIIRKTRKIQDDIDKSYTIIELLVGEDSEVMAVFDSMSVAEFTDFIEQWSEGASLGESSGFGS